MQEADEVHIVLRMKGSKWEVDEVFYDLDAATNHRKNLTKKWAITDIVTKEVKML